MSDPPDDRDAQAAEYVLGTLDAAEARAVEQQAVADPVLAATIQAWQARLAPLAALAEPVVPPSGLWARIETTIGGAPPRASGPLVRAWRSIALWRTAAAGGFAVAAALVALLLLRPPPPPTAVAALVRYGDTDAAFVAEALPDGKLLLRPLAPVEVAAGHDLELWALPAGAIRPVALGLLPVQGQGRALTSPPPRTQLLVSLEPKGGSPTGLPTGPVLYAGTLSSP